MKQNEKNNKISNSLDIDFNVLKQLVDLVQNSKIGRIKICKSGFEVEVESEKSVVGCGASSVGESKPFEAVGGLNFSEQGRGNDEILQGSGNLVSSPIVGTFYASPAPGKPAFVEVGSLVKKGDVIYIIESMKLMNEVRSEFEGEVKKIFVESGEPVEFGQPIMIIE